MINIGGKCKINFRNTIILVDVYNNAEGLLEIRSSASGNVHDYILNIHTYIRT